MLTYNLVVVEDHLGQVDTNLLHVVEDLDLQLLGQIHLNEQVVEDLEYGTAYQVKSNSLQYFTLLPFDLLNGQFFVGDLIMHDL